MLALRYNAYKRFKLFLCMTNRTKSGEIPIDISPISPKDYRTEGPPLPHSGTLLTVHLMPHVRNAVYAGFFVRPHIFRGYTGSVGPNVLFGYEQANPLSFWRVLVSDAISENSVPVSDRNYFKGVLLRPVFETCQGAHEPNVLTPHSFYQLVEHVREEIGILTIHNPVVQADLTWLREHRGKLQSIIEHATLPPMALYRRSLKKGK